MHFFQELALHSLKAILCRESLRLSPRPCALLVSSGVLGSLRYHTIARRACGHLMGTSGRSVAGSCGWLSAAFAFLGGRCRSLQVHHRRGDEPVRLVTPARPGVGIWHNP
jgi:hypothetical protein